MGGQVPFHESGQQQVYGVDDMCLYNEHPMCRNPRCGCSCHKQARIAADQAGVNRVVATEARTASIQTGLDKYCPKCHVKAHNDQNFCKMDGSKLSSLRCPECNSPGEESDNHCGYCGCSMKATDRQLEAAATGSGIAESYDEISGDRDAAEVAMKAAMKARVTVKTVPAPARPAAKTVTDRMFK